MAATLAAVAPVAAVNPVIFTFTESPGRERYAVHAGGEISRPAIGYGPSGGWLFLGVSIAREALSTPLPQLFKLLATGQGRDALPHTCYVQDLDHGTRRGHGASLADLRLAPGLPADWPELARARLAERAAREETERARKAAERLALARKGGRTVAMVNGIKVRRNGTGYCVIDGDAAAIGLTFAQAAEMVGAALIERES